MHLQRDRWLSHTTSLYCTVTLHVDAQKPVQYVTNTHVRFFIQNSFPNLGERLGEFCHQHGIPFLASYSHKKTVQKRARARSPLTLQPNMSESVRLLHISLHWHITGEKHLRFLRGGDITSTPIDTKHTDHRPLRCARGQKGTVMTVREERVYSNSETPPKLSHPDAEREVKR